MDFRDFFDYPGAEPAADANDLVLVRLKDGRTLPCEAFLACAGVRPDTALAVAAGLKVSQWPVRGG